MGKVVLVVLEIADCILCRFLTGHFVSLSNHWYRAYNAGDDERAFVEIGMLMNHQVVLSPEYKTKASPRSKLHCKM